MKIDDNGQYLTYPGVTVVSSIKDTDKPFWHLIDDVLQRHQEFKKFFSPLPYESYHLTTINLFTKEEIGSQHWKDFITSNTEFFQSLNYMLKEKTFTPFLTLESIRLSGVLQIMFELPQEQLEWIREVAIAHDVEIGIPSVFHITLAYQFNNVENSVLDSLFKEIHQEILSIFESRQNHLSLNPPELCIFNDMTQFIPWNGRGFPFEAYRFFSSDLVQPKKNTSLHGCTIC